MTSNDFIIRTERNVIVVVLSSEGKIVILRRDFEEFKLETRQEFALLRQEIRSIASDVRAMERHIDSMTTIFGWGFALVAIVVAAAPILREFFVYRHDKNLSDDIDAKIDRRIREALDARNDSH